MDTSIREKIVDVILFNFAGGSLAASLLLWMLLVKAAPGRMWIEHLIVVAAFMFVSGMWAIFNARDKSQPRLATILWGAGFLVAFLSLLMLLTIPQ